MTEGEEQEDGTWLFFGYVTGLTQDEWGYFTSSELESIQGIALTGAERDLYYEGGKTVKDFLQGD